MPNSDEGERPPRDRRQGLRARLLRRYFALKYRLFRKERRSGERRRGVVVLQIDALAFPDLRRAMEAGYCPTITRLVKDQAHTLRPWFCGLPSATPYCQAGILHGENDGIPAFRFYDRESGKVITCNAPAGVQYIRDHITSPGALAGGSSYVNLLDGDARQVAFTVATRDRKSAFDKLGGGRMLLLLALHPVRILRMGFQAVFEWFREEWERAVHELRGQRTHSEGLFPFIRVASNVVIRELQTMAILLDVYLGVPIIYSTFMQYDELAHHFGPSSKASLRDLKRTDARIREILRMIRHGAPRAYDIIILSDHGMTPAESYRVRFGETLGATVQGILDDDAERAGDAPLQAKSAGGASEYAGVPALTVDEVMHATAQHRVVPRRALRRFGEWVRSRYGLRELIMPEKYFVGERHDVVVTYSSPLAWVYFAESRDRLDLGEITRDRRRAYLYARLVAHEGIGLVGTLSGPAVHLESRVGRALLCDGEIELLDQADPLAPYGTDPALRRAVERLVRQHNAGDLLLFGAYDGYEIVCFDDQIGAHGAAGGPQVQPFIIGPPSLRLDSLVLEDARDIHDKVLKGYIRR